MENHRNEILIGHRFEFGANWTRFLAGVTNYQIHMAEQSLQEMLQVKSLQNKTFLDIGSGSGLFSLAARRLGAKVRSFDFDPQSVACTKELRRRYYENDSNWIIEEASALDDEFINSLGKFDVVYSWGVLHHTGSMWKGLGNAASLVQEDGKIFIAIYNDQGRASRIWLLVKQLYNRLPFFLRWLVVIPTFIRLWGPTTLRDLLRGKPFATWRNYAQERMRGMNPWYDLIDWIGGLPFEVATPEAIFEYYQPKGFMLTKLKTCAGGLGCNEFVFTRHS